MNRLALLLPLLLAPALCAGDWTAWRGPAGSGVSDETDLPLRWSATEGVRWKVALPGAGVSAPIVAKDKVFVTCSSGRHGDQLHLFCFSRDTGKQLWECKLFGSSTPEGSFAPGGMAVPTPATDGERVYALFGTGDLVCVDGDGKPVWIRSLAKEHGPFRNRWGMASSPLLLGDSLIVLVDHWGGSYLEAFDTSAGKTRWRTPRDTAVNWSSPVALEAGGKRQIVTAGTYELRSYDGSSGKELWRWRGLHMQCIPTPVVQGDRLFLACGEGFTSVAFTLDREGKPRKDWQVESKGVGVPSPLCVGEYYYFLEDSGWIDCLEAKTGKKVYRQRLSGKVQASPVAGAGRIYVPGVNGTVMVLRAGPHFQVLARNDIGEGVVASPALAHGALFLRGERHLFCIGGK